MPHAFGQPFPDRSTVVHPDCVGIVLKQNNFATMVLHYGAALTFQSSYRPNPCFRAFTTFACKFLTVSFSNCLTIECASLDAQII